jgi:DNA-directed RNA polymerase sigma subunit (sigma70/sigma32)
VAAERSLQGALQDLLSQQQQQQQQGEQGAAQRMVAKSLLRVVAKLTRRDHKYVHARYMLAHMEVSGCND